MIVKNGNSYTLMSQDGTKRLGTYPSQAAAQAREKQVNYFKNLDAIKRKASGK